MASKTEYNATIKTPRSYKSLVEFAEKKGHHYKGLSPVNDKKLLYRKLDKVKSLAKKPFEDAPCFPAGESTWSDEYDYDDWSY